MSIWFHSHLSDPERVSIGAIIYETHGSGTFALTYQVSSESWEASAHVAINQNSCLMWGLTDGLIHLFEVSVGGSLFAQWKALRMWLNE